MEKRRKEKGKQKETRRKGDDEERGGGGYCTILLYRNFNIEVYCQHILPPIHHG